MRKSGVRAGVGTLLTLALVVGCSGDDDDAGSPSDSSDASALGVDDLPSPGAVEDLPTPQELEAGLLTVADLPTGWAQSADEEDDGDRFCGIRLGRLLGLEIDELPNAAREFERDGRSAVFGESIGFAPEGRASEALRLVAAELDGCEDELDGEPVAVTPLSFPTLGDESAAFQLRIGDEESGTTDFAVVYARVGDLLLVLHAADLVGSSTDVMEELGPVAVDHARAALL